MIKFSVTPEFGSDYEVTADSRDIFVWEKTSGKKFSDLSEGTSMTDLYSICFFASKREHLTEVANVKEFADSVKLAFDEDAPPTPFREGR